MIVKAMSFTEIRDQGTELLAEYAAECRIAALGEPEPQWAMYEALEGSRTLHGFGVFHHGFAGFATVLVSVLPHYGVRAAIVESLFVGSKWRKSGAGALLMRAVERCAREAGCTAMLCSAPTGGKLEIVLDADRNFTRTNAVFCKALGEFAGVAGECEAS